MKRFLRTLLVASLLFSSIPVLPGNASAAESIDQQATVPSQMAYQLAFSDQAGIDFAKQYLSSPDPTIRTNAYEVVEAFGSDQDAAALQHVIGDSSSPSNIIDQAKGSLQRLVARVKSKKKHQAAKVHSGQAIEFTSQEQVEAAELNVTVTNVGHPESPVFQETMTKLPKKKAASFTWKTDDNTLPGLYKVRFHDPVKGTSTESDEIQYAVVTYQLSNPPVMLAAASDTYEPNDTIANAYPTYPTTVNSYISVDGDKDYYKFSYDHDGKATFTLYIPTGGGVYSLGITDASGTRIGYQTSAATGRVNFTADVKANTTYYALVCGGTTNYTQNPDGTWTEHTYYNASSGYQMILGPVRYPIDNNEPNDSQAAAYPIALGTYLDSYLSSKTDVDYYKMTTTSAGTLSVNLSVPHAWVDYNLYVYDGIGQLVASSTDTSWGNETVGLGVAANSNYYIKIVTADDWINEPYRLSVSPLVTTDTMEPNDSLATAAPILTNTNVNSYLSVPNERDFYKFTTTSSGTLEVMLTSPSGLTYNMDLYNAAGTVVSSGASRKVLAVEPGQSYSVRIYASNNTSYSASIPYNLSIGAVQVDTYEPNDTYYMNATTVTPGSTNVSYISQNSDADYYQLTPTTTGTVEVTLEVPTGKDYDLYAFDSNNVLISSSAQSTGLAERLVLGVTANTKYYLLAISSRTNVYGSQPYQLKLGNVVADTYENNDVSRFASVVKTGSATTSYISQSDDKDYFQVTSSTTGTVEIVLQVPPTQDYNLSVYDSSNNLIETSASSTRGQTERVVVGLGANVRYNILISAPSGMTSPDTPYTLTINNPVPDTYENNDTTSLATLIWSTGSTFTSFLSQPGDLDYYRFSAPAAAGYRANLVVPAGLDYQLQLLDSNNNVVATSANGAGTAKTLTWSAPSSYTMYYLLVTGVNGAASATSGYTLQVLADNYEPNDSFVSAYAMTPNSVFTSLIGSTGDNDYYSFVASNGGYDHLSLKVPANVNYDVAIYDANRNLIASSTQPTGVREEVRFPVTSGNTYYVKIFSPAGDSNSSSTYSFKMTQVLWKYQYDSANRLLNATLSFGFNVTSTSFTYDANGSMLSRTTTTATN